METAEKAIATIDARRNFIILPVNVKVADVI
jgi:hypothetical protein